MPITKVTARALRVPVKQATRISTRLLDKRDYLLVTVEVDDSDEVGIGYAYAGTTGGKLLREAVNGLLGAKLVEENPDDIYGLWRRLYQETLLTGRRGAVICGLSAIDMALWDLSAKRRKVPLAVLLGGAVGGVPAYASGGYYRPDDGGWNDAVAKEIAFNRQLGFNSHKIKVGGLSVREDAARVAAAIAAMGPEGASPLTPITRTALYQKLYKLFEHSNAPQARWGSGGSRSLCRRMISRGIARSRPPSKRPLPRAKFIRHVGSSVS